MNLIAKNLIPNKPLYIVVVVNDHRVGILPRIREHTIGNITHHWQYAVKVKAEIVDGWNHLFILFDTVQICFDIEQHRESNPEDHTAEDDHADDD